MGLPGSSITEGNGNFMHQALAQTEARKVRVEDGWVYFIYGWATVCGAGAAPSFDG